MIDWVNIEEAKPPLNKQVAVILRPEFSGHPSDVACVDQDGIWHGLCGWYPPGAVSEWKDAA